jgi:cytochrome c oxidase subunit IV
VSDSTDTLPVPAHDDRDVPVPVDAEVVASVTHHPDPRQYVMIAVVLVVVTALEVAISYMNEDVIGPNWIILLLATMAVVKFTLVVAWYMHLKTDSRTLRRFFLVGLFGAIVLYIIVSLTLHAWQPAYNHVVK